MARNGPTVAIYEFSFISKQSIYTNDKDGGRSKNLRGTIAKENLFLLIFYVGKQCIAMGRGGRACATSAPPVLAALNRCKKNI